MASRILQRDTAVITRYAGTGTISDLGEETLAVASGFPVTAKGYFRHKSSDSAVTFGGRDRTVVAEFVSSSYHDGKLGDKLAHEGTTYTVIARSHKDDSTGKDDHTRYTLGNESTGDADNAG